jgi:hypothetical protein
MMQEVFEFVATFKEFPPRSFPPSFNPANILEGMMDGIKEKKALIDGMDVDKVRAGLNRIIQEQIQQAR